MDLNFDIRGNLKPYKKVSLDFKNFKELFVDSFGMDSTRHKIFEQYELYLNDFKKEVAEHFTHWIDGSFVTNKYNPKDIDFVNLIDYQVINNKETILRNQFIKNNVLKKYGIDAYLVALYPKNHKLYNWTQSDLLYWNDWFSKSKMNHHKKRFPKGYIEIIF